MGTVNPSTVVICESATTRPRATNLVITRAKAKIKQDKYWRKIQEYAITHFPELMNAEERLQDQKNNLFKGILIENQRIEKPPWREVVYDKQFVGPSLSRFNTPNQTRADPVLTLANSRTTSVAPYVTGITHSGSNPRLTYRAKLGATHSSSSLVNQAKTRAAVRALVTTTTALSQCRDCSVVLTRIDTSFGVKSSALNVTLIAPLKSVTCATSHAKFSTLALISSSVIPRLISLTKTGADKVSTNPFPGSIIRAASLVAESVTVGCLNTKPFATQPETRAAVRSTALAAATALSQCRDCLVVLRRVDTTSEFKSASPSATTTTRWGSASCANSRAKSDGPDVAVTSLTLSSNTRVTSRAKTSATYRSVMQQPKTRSAVRAALSVLPQ